MYILNEGVLIFNNLNDLETRYLCRGVHSFIYQHSSIHSGTQPLDMEIVNRLQITNLVEGRRHKAEMENQSGQYNFIFTIQPSLTKQFKYFLFRHTRKDEVTVCIPSLTLNTSLLSGTVPKIKFLY